MYGTGYEGDCGFAMFIIQRQAAKGRPVSPNTL